VKPKLNLLFGNTQEVKVISMIIPLAMAKRVYVDDLVKATGLSKEKLGKIIDRFVVTGYTIDGQNRAWFTLGDSKVALSVYNLMHAMYDDELIAEQEKVLKGERNEDRTN
jgi:hypothetical protein